MKEIKISALSKRYSTHIVFKNFHCNFLPQKWNCIIGPSGAGKTTLLRILMGLEGYQGKITGIEGKKFSCVFQENRLCEEFSGIENVKMVTNKKTDPKKILHELRQLGLADDANLPASQYSGGMKRRLAIARALVVKYDILILDEPFRELDQNTYQRVLNYVEKKAMGKTVILSTHNPYEIKRFGENKIYI